MTYKTIMVHAGTDTGAEARLRAALEVGRLFEAAVMGVGAMTWEPPIDVAFQSVGAEIIPLLYDQVETGIRGAKAGFQKATAGYPHPVLWREMVDYPDRVMDRLARRAGLVVASFPQAHADDLRVPSAADLVMGSGLPVLLAPMDQPDFRPRTVLVAWKNGREARRALSDALSFLKRADRVVVAQICEDDGARSPEVELEDVAARLERHGIDVSTEALPQREAAVADDLMDLAATCNANLVVAGAYGHARLREWAFGGVTRDLLHMPERFVLLSR